MRQGAPILVLIKPIGLCGTQKAPENLRTRPTILDTPYRAEVLMANLLYENFFLGVHTWLIAHFLRLEK